MRVVFFILYISLFFCKNVGAVHHAYTQELQHGHFSLPKSNSNTRLANLKAEQVADYGLVEDAEDINDIEIADDLEFDVALLNLNWLSNYLAGLLYHFQHQIEVNITPTIDFDETLSRTNPIYILQQVFRI